MQPKTMAKLAIDLNELDTGDDESVQMLAFLKDLDNARNVVLTDWEAKFISDNLLSERTLFSPAQKNVIRKLKEKYQARL